MPSNYAKVRRQWRDVDIERDLRALWASERFESTEAVEDALRVYEMAIRVEGWDQVKAWAREQLDGGILHAQLVELAMRALEQGDRAFLEEMTAHLLDNSAPNYFRFWYTLFSARHAHLGERVFRAQLAELSDYRIVKYRRWLRRILRKLRFRCKSPREKAIGAIVFAMYGDYDPAAYPSDVFRAYLACHDAARTRKKSKSGKQVSKSRQMDDVATAAAELGIWTIAEGIRTSAGLPRTLTYLAKMAPRMTDLELMRALRAFDDKLQTADHKRASEEVVSLARYLEQRLGGMEVAVEEWCKIFPYQKSPVLVRVFEDLIGAGVTAAAAALGPLSGAALVPIVPEPLDGRRFRVALALSYLLYRNHAQAGAYLLGAGGVQALSPPSPLWPYGYHQEPPVWRWHPEPEGSHQVLFQLVRDTFPAAATRRSAQAVGVSPYVTGLRHHLYRRAVLDGGAVAADVPVLFLVETPSEDERKALLAHLEMFSAAVVISFDQPLDPPLAGSKLIQLTVPTEVVGAARALAGLSEQLASARQAFDQVADSDRAARDRAVRHLRLERPPQARAIAQGPYYDSSGAAASRPAQTSEPPPATPVPPPSPPPARGEAGGVTIVLTSAGPQKIMAIKLVRELTGLSLRDAKHVVDSAPCPIQLFVSRAEADSAVKQFAAIGAEAAVRS
ncbi:ribosomal protein L7/L12 [Haliangium sp.]|uniref:ribosomal protein L7/L12 n=1 Tax=Haliangium sp. TaxID=2663208 RepID=UPI003D109D2D